MTAYEELLAHVLDNGTRKQDRTGTGTRSVFGHQMRFDLAEGFPLITTKRMFTRGMIEELLWFIRGETNEHVLRDKNVHFWKAWARKDGELGPIYGKQFRHVSTFLPVKPAIYEPSDTTATFPPLVRHTKNLNERTVYGVGYYGDYDKQDPHHLWLAEIWRQMIRRCYDETCRAYPGYGRVGVHVSEEWQCYANFQQDVKQVPNWVMKLEYPDEFSLDKDTKLASNRYSRETCMWASNFVQDANKSNTRPFTATSPLGKIVECPSIGRLAREEGMSASAIHRCLNGQLHKHHGWTNFTYMEAPEGMVIRYNEVDQVKTLIASLKHDPDSRRHMISLWNPAEVDFAELPPCHGSVIQFYVADGKLSAHMYQRSADLFLGVPVNIASYALLTHMVAQQTGYEPGEFVWTGGDCHIYDNHVEQVQTQLGRDPYPFPTLKLDAAPSIFDYTPDHITVNNYQHHPTITAPVAV